ncbi:hypothetical protein SAMN05216327_11235 [Dyadobacter sp. SG02]|uniref:DUF6602 domain-containing protein n=1 Tax=Dyadobacter sp. SG02 TaxID=1855291 RepID=UPI0008B81382|nr:DUF6602 domain-containing protein [Dyadobacter sp. SG02]SEJ52856.1 hypothetical protein SAMN05216327_11235 [Dyadobacter sp. SG02]
MSEVNYTAYYQLKAAELLNQLSQVRVFIKRHNPTIGLLTEEILRKFLSTFLPKGISVEQGFVVGSGGELSRQIDIIVYDSHLYAPFYRINDIVVIPSEAVLAIVEVKTTVSGEKAFHDVIKYFYSVSEQVDPQVTKYLFIYDAPEVSKLITYFRSFEHPGDYQEFDHDTFHLLPDVIVGIDSSYCLKKSYVCFDRDMMGYKSYNYVDSTDEAISSLEIFYQSIYEMVFARIASREGSVSTLPTLRKDGRKFNTGFAIELFYM